MHGWGQTAFVAALALMAATAEASSPIAIRTAVFVEKEGSAGAARMIETASLLRRGERVVLLLNWRAPPGARNFTVTAPVPSTLSFERSSSGAEEISVDNGRSWGRLGQLRLRDRDGERLAQAGDITHLRWKLNGALLAGRITYSAVVR